MYIDLCYKEVSFSFVAFHRRYMHPHVTSSVFGNKLFSTIKVLFVPAFGSTLMSLV